MIAIQQPRPAPFMVLLPLLVGAAVALGLGVFGNVHDPQGKTVITEKQHIERGYTDVVAKLSQLGATISDQ